MSGFAKQFIIFLIVTFVARPLWAQDYYWYAGPNTNDRYTSATQACSSFSPPGYYFCNFKSVELSPHEGGGAKCLFQCGNTEQLQNISNAARVKADFKLVADEEDASSYNQCAGNPIDIVTGAKIQREEVLTAQNENQIGFYWRYNSRPTNEKYWRHAYSYSLQRIDPYSPNLIVSLYKGSNKSAVCRGGWAQVKDQFEKGSMASATVVYENDACKVVINGRKVREVAIVPFVHMSQNRQEAGVDSGYVYLNRPDGTRYKFVSRGEGRFEAVNGAAGTLFLDASSESPWVYTLKTGRVEQYTLHGKISSIISPNHVKLSFLYDDATGLLNEVANNYGQKLIFLYKGDKIDSIALNSKSVANFEYNENGLLSKWVKASGEVKYYHYENSTYPKALTGISLGKEKKRYATWSYDDAGRATTSEHANGIDKTKLLFEDDMTTVTNALGKSTTYHLNYVAGARRVSKVEGLASANCIASNRSYDYYENGFLKSKTDWKGNTTSYEYNSMGQVTKEVTGEGTSKEVQTITEYHSDTHFISKIISPSKTTVYQYNQNGQLERLQATSSQNGQVGSGS